MVTVYVWFPTSSSYGHSSLQLNQEYISWWPINGKMSIVGTPAFDSRTREDDLHAEERRPDHSIPLKGLDEVAISAWWKKWRNSREYRALDRNCSTTVAKALAAGGGTRFCGLSLVNCQVVWTPNRLWEYARAISIGIHTPR